MYELKHFENGPLQSEVRTLYIDGVVWFVLMDVARIFGYRDAGRVTHMLRDTQWLQADDTIRDALGVRGRAPYLVNESGFYRLANRSSRPEAEPFQVWVEDEVLPSIRREGGYISNTATAEQLTQLQAQVDKAEKRALKAEENEKATERGVQQWQRNTDREVEILLDDVRKSRDFWGNAYMRMREEAGRICREHGVSEKRLPIV